MFGTAKLGGQMPSNRVNEYISNAQIMNVVAIAKMVTINTNVSIMYALRITHTYVGCWNCPF